MSADRRFWNEVRQLQEALAAPMRDLTAPSIRSRLALRRRLDGLLSAELRREFGRWAMLEVLRRASEEND